MGYTEEDLLNKIPAIQRPVFKEKAKSIAAHLGVPFYHLLAIMDVESGMNPAIQNKYGYTGLIQFGTTAASELGTTTAALKNMTAVQQLDYVKRYYDMWIKRLGLKSIDSFADLYLLVLYPAGVKIESETTPVMPKSVADKQANILKDSTGNITKDSITQGYSDRYAGLIEAGAIFARKHWVYLLIGSLCLIVAGFLIYNEIIAKKPLLQLFPDRVFK